MSAVPGLCECGCGQATNLAQDTRPERGWLKGEPLRFVHGHMQAGLHNKPDMPLTAAQRAYLVRFDGWTHRQSASTLLDPLLKNLMSRLATAE